jgi:hypothetical protein
VPALEALAAPLLPLAPAMSLLVPVPAGAFALQPSKLVQQHVAPKTTAMRSVVRIQHLPGLPLAKARPI